MFGAPVSVGNNLPAGANPETINYGMFSVQHQGGFTPQAFNPPKPATGFVPAPTGLPSLPMDLTSSFVSPDVIEEFSGVRENTGRFPAQKKAMSQMSAAQANARANQDIPQQQMDWLHRHRFTHGGINHFQPNEPENLVSGMHGANIRHLMLENAVTHVSPQVGVIPISTGLRDARSEAHHVYGQMDYTTHSVFNPEIEMTEPIDLRDPMMPRRADQGYANIAQETFQNWGLVHEMIQSGAMSPADLGDAGMRQYQQFLARFRHQ